MSHRAVADVVWDILSRPRHRRRWEPWQRPGAVPRRSTGNGHGGDIDGAQSAIAWVVDDHRYEGVRHDWELASSTASTRSAVQRFFGQGARPLSRFTSNGPIEGCTKSKVLIDIVHAFELDEDEVGEVRDAFATSPGGGSSWHMGHSLHTWETARSDDDLKGVVQLSRQIIGGSAGFKPATLEAPAAADVAPLRDRLNVRADALELCLRHALGTNDETLVGYMLAYPLDANVTAAILTGEVTSAEEIDDSQVATSFADEASLYIGMVLGCDTPARASVMERCIQRATTWAASHPGGHVLAKRSTEDGGRWLESYGFTPVTDRDGIWVRDPSVAPARKRRRRLIAIAS